MSSGARRRSPGWAGLFAALLVVAGAVVLVIGWRDPGPQRLSTPGAIVTDAVADEPSPTATIPDDEGSTGGTSTTVSTTSVPATTTIASTTSPTTPASIAAVSLTNRCSSPWYGWDISYPDGWYAADATADVWECAAFDPAPVLVNEDTELDASVIMVFYERDLRTVHAELLYGVEVLSQADVTVGPYPAVRLELRATGDGYWPAGTLLVNYLVDRGGWATVQIEGVAVDDAPFRDVTEVVDAMAGTISFWDS